MPCLNHSANRPIGFGVTEFDYIIPGGGSAGCVLADRLSKDPDVTVLRLEPGGRDNNLFLLASRICQSDHWTCQLVRVDGASKIHEREGNLVYTGEDHRGQGSGIENGIVKIDSAGITMNSAFLRRRKELCV